MNYQDLQIDWLKCFVAVVDAGSLSNATASVHRSQSAVSMQLKKLELAVGQKLLIRNNRHTELTTEGQMLLGYARRILDLHSEVQAAFHGEELVGQVKLGVPDDYAAKYLTPVLRNFAPRFGGVEIELTCEQSTSLIPKIVSNDLDLALVSRDNASRGTLLSMNLWSGLEHLNLNYGDEKYCRLLFMRVQALREEVPLTHSRYKENRIKWFTIAQA